MRRRLLAVHLVVAAVVAGSTVHLSVPAANASTGQVDIVVEYSSNFGIGEFFVSPDGSVVAFPIFGPGDDFTPSTEIVGVRLVDLTTSTRDDTIMFDWPASLFQGNPIAFSKDSSVLYVNTEIELLLIDTATFTVVGGIPLGGGFSTTVRYSPTFDYFYDWLPPVTFGDPPVLVLGSTGQLVPTFEATTSRGNVNFSAVNPRAFVDQPYGVLQISLTTGEPTPVFFDGVVTLGRAGELVAETPSGDVIVMTLREQRGFTVTGLVVIDANAGEVLTELPVSDFGLSTRLAGVSPNGRFLLFQEESFDPVQGVGSSALTVFSVDTGETTPWEEPLLGEFPGTNIFPLTSGNRSAWFVENSGLLLTFNWDTLTVESEKLVGLPAGLWGTWRPALHVASTDELLLVASDINYDNFDFGDFPNRPASGTIVVTYAFDWISLEDQAGFVIRGSALGLDASGTLAVSLNEVDRTVSVWDVETQTLRSIFPLTVWEADFDYPRLLDTYANLPPNRNLLVSPDGQTVYFVVTRALTFFEGGENSSDVIVWAMSTETGQFSQVAFFDNAYVRVTPSHFDGDTIILGLSAPDDWETPVTIVDVSVNTATVTELFTVPFPGETIQRVGDDRFALFGSGSVSTLVESTGRQGPDLVFPGSGGGITQVAVSSTGQFAAAAITQYDFSSSGQQLQQGGVVAVGQIPADDSSTDQLADVVANWDAENSAVVAFSYNETLLYVVSDEGVSIFSLPDGEQLPTSAVDVSFPANSRLETALLSPDGGSIWVGISVGSSVAGFYDVPLPELVDSEESSQSSGMVFIPEQFPGWFIPGALLAVSLVVGAVWLSRRPSLHVRFVEGERSCRQPGDACGVARSL